MWRWTKRIFVVLGAQPTHSVMSGFPMCIERIKASTCANNDGGKSGISIGRDISSFGGG
jgi:hypothetical protein